jgi:glycosyltransferase involved in cell wall biosynthesis
MKPGDTKTEAKANDAQPTIALLPWGDVWEDFFSTIGVDFPSFCNEVTGGWQFGFIEALKLYGVRTVMFYTSTQFNQVSRFVHKPTGSTICVLPVPPSYRAIRSRMIHSYPSMAYWGSLEDLFGDVKGAKRMWFALLRQIAPYLTTTLRLLGRELRRESCSAIFCQEYEYARFDQCVLLGKMMRLPVFATFQGGSAECNRIGRFLRPMTIRMASGLAIGSQAEINRVRSRYNLNPGKISRIFNPVDLRMWEPVDRNQARDKFGIPHDAEVVVWHGRVHVEEKGLDVLLDSWKDICAKRPRRDLRLLLMGSAEHTETLRERIAEMPLKNILWIDRYVNDRKTMRDFLYTGDVFAFPSRFEGFPVSPLEAMACGLPVVAADASGVSDIFEEGEASGGIVVPRNDVKSFSDALGCLLDDPSLRREMGQRARRRIADCFSLETIGQQLSRLLFPL